MIYISGNVPSSKNSKQWTGKYLIHSKTTREYIINSKNEWLINKNKFLEMIKGKEKPYLIKFYFVRDSKRKFDYINACQLPCDLMVKYGWIEDDNTTQIIPYFVGYEVDKNKAGVYIDIGEREDNTKFIKKLNAIRSV